MPHFSLSRVTYFKSDLCAQTYIDTLNIYVHFLSFSQGFKTDKVIITGDFNIHVEVENNSLFSTFIPLLDSIGFCRRC